MQGSRSRRSSSLFQVLQIVDHARVDDYRVHWRNNEAPHDNDIMEPILHGGKTHLAHSTVAAVIDVRGPSWSARSCDETRTCSEFAICKGHSDHLPGYCVVPALISIELDEYSAQSAPKVTPFVFALLSALGVRSPLRRKL